MQVAQGFEFVSLIEFLLVFPMASFNRSVLIWFASVNEVMNDVVLSAKNIQRMQSFNGPIASLIGAGVKVGESGMIVGLDSQDPALEFLYNDF